MPAKKPRGSVREAGSMNVVNEIDTMMEKLNAIRPFEGAQLKQLYEHFRIRTTYSSNAIEGNTLTLSETELIIKDGITVGGHPLWELMEAVGHSDAYRYMFALINKRKITESNIKHCHGLFSRIIPDFHKPGEYRDLNVIITKSKYPLPDHTELPGLMKDLISWMNEKREKYHPVEFAAEAHRRFVYIHPFSDGNGRVARLLMNTLLLQDKYLPVCIEPAVRRQYIETLEQGRKYAKPFTNFIVTLELNTIKEYMRMLRIK
jgi:Fic family protein